MSDFARITNSVWDCCCGTGLAVRKGLQICATCCNEEDFRKWMGTFLRSDAKEKEEEKNELNPRDTKAEEEDQKE